MERFSKGLITAGVTGALDAAIQDLTNGKLNWQQIAIAAGAAAAAYLKVALLTGPKPDAKL